MKGNPRTNEILIAIIIAVAVLGLFGGSTMMGFGNSWMYGMMGSSFGIGMLFGFLINLLIIIALILFVFWLIKNIGKRI